MTPLSKSLIVALLFPTICLADDGYIAQTGAALNYGKNKQIQMVSERVVIQMHLDYSYVDATFRFKNLGKCTSVMMGFPESADRPRESLRNFRSTVDGRTVIVKRKHLGEEYAGHQAIWLKRVVFGAGQTRTVNVKYRANNGFLFNGSMWHDYTLTTGATWAGKIGTCELVVDTSRFKWANPIVPLLPGEGTDGPAASWRVVRPGVKSTVLKDIEPDFNLRVFATDGFWKFKINGKVVPVEYGEYSNPVWPRLIGGRVYVTAQTRPALFGGDANPRSLDWGNPDVPVKHVDQDPSAWPPGVVRVPGREDIKLPHKNRWLHEGLEGRDADMFELRDIVKALGGSCSFDRKSGYVLIDFPKK